MNPPSEDIKDILEASSAGLDLEFGTDMFIGLMPEKPDNCIVIVDTGGFPPAPKYTYRYPTLQIRSRNNNNKSAWTELDDISGVLHALYEETWNSTRYIQILAQTEPLFLGQDERQRFQYSINFEIHRTTG